MKLVVLGGTGFLGHFIVGTAVERGHQVVAYGRPPAPSRGYLPASADVVLADYNTVADDDLLRVFAGADAVVFGGGADGRDLFPRPALEAYRQANVEPLRRLVPLLLRAGTPRLVILGSFYTALERTFPALRLSAVHPYVASRKEQATIAFELAGNRLAVGVLELPYIFGAAPGRGTLWGFTIRHVQAHEVVPIPAGGTACVTARQVGLATAAACERLVGQRHFAIVDSNLSFADLYGEFAKALRLERTFRRLSPAEAIEQARGQEGRLSASGTEHGMNPLGLAELQAIPAHLDPLPAMETLGYGPDDLSMAIMDSVRATLRYGS